MSMHAGVSLLILLLVASLAAGCSKSEPPKPAPAPSPAVSAAAEGKTLFEKKCGVCHGFDRATARKESKEKWMEVVKSMQGKKADWISDEEAVKIVEYLASEHGKK